jgi:hypothetical protein
MRGSGQPPQGVDAVTDADRFRLPICCRTRGAGKGVAMTEAEWLACTDPRQLLAFLRGKASDRKLRLFACAYCRAVRSAQHLRPGTAVAVAERYADGLAGDQDLASERRGVPFPNEYAEWVLARSPYEGAWQPVDWLTSARDLMKLDPDAVRHFPIPLDEVVERSVRYLRDIFDNPFRPVTIDPAWLTWRDGTLPKLAQDIYDERAFDRLPILADALEDAGCDNADILTHCRGPGPHVRGCWVVDLLLGKE